MKLRVNEQSLVLDVSGAAYWPDEAMLIVADLHLEKGTSFARSGQLLPPYDSRTTVEALARLIAFYRPSTVLALGDSFHDAEAALRLDPQARAQLAEQMAVAQWIFLCGNHDVAPPAWSGAIVQEEYRARGLCFRHEPGRSRCEGEVAGHLHPVATVTRLGRAVRRRCFLSDGSRMVLPAFGAYAGGLDRFDMAFDGLFAGYAHAFVLGRERVYAVG